MSKKAKEAAQAIVVALSKTDINAKVVVDGDEVKVKCSEKDEERIFNEIIEKACGGSSEKGLLYGCDVFMVSPWFDGGECPFDSTEDYLQAIATACMLIPEEKLAAEAKRIFSEWKPSYPWHDTRSNFLDFCNMQANDYALDFYKKAYEGKKYWEDMSWAACKDRINDIALAAYDELCGGNDPKTSHKLFRDGVEAASAANEPDTTSASLNAVTTHLPVFSSQPAIDSPKESTQSSSLKI